MVVDDEFKSQACKTIHYTHNETLAVLRCCELPKSVWTHSILVWKVCKTQVNFDPTHDWKTHCGDHFRPHAAISTIYPTIHYLYFKLDVGRVGMLWYSWTNHTYTILVWNVGTLEPILSPPMTQKLGCSDGCGWWIQISTLQNHSLYSWSENRRVEMLWIAQISANSLNLGVKRGGKP